MTKSDVQLKYISKSQRERFAGMALQGLCSHRFGYTPEQMAKDAVNLADALIAELKAREDEERPADDTQVTKSYGTTPQL